MYKSNSAMDDAKQDLINFYLCDLFKTSKNSPYIYFEREMTNPLARGINMTDDVLKNQKLKTS